jgi:ankyrin repeat protein
MASRNLQITAWLRGIGLCAALLPASLVCAAEPIELINEALVSARSGDIEQLHLALAHGASVNTRSRIGDSLLLVAIKGDQTEYALSVLEAGASPELPNAAGVTPLMAAAFQGNVVVLKSLIARHVALGAIDHLHKPAMVYAAGEGRTEAVAVLLDAGVAVNARYDAQLTALMWAAGNGHADTVRLLLQRGADPTLADDRGKDAAHMAAEGGYTEITNLLAHGG